LKTVKKIDSLINTNIFNDYSKKIIENLKAGFRKLSESVG